MTFFIIVPPGFEPLALSELQFKQALPADIEPSQIRLLKGGIELDLPLDIGLQLNVKSQLATRVLVRIEKFRCRDFPKLFKKTQGIDWSKWLSGPFELSVSAHRSRLMNKKRIEATVGDAIEKQSKKSLYLKNDDEAGASSQRVYIRFENDEVEFSLDTSGEALFKRGYKHLEATAPIRENLAAGLFWSLYEKAGRPQDFIICDLMCGSGTLLTEAAIFFESLHEIQQPKAHFFGFDKSSEAIQITEKNAANLNLQKLVTARAADFLMSPILTDIKAEIRAQPKYKIGLSNPPYGLRLKWPRPPREFYAALVEAYRALGCDIFGFIVPRSALSSVPKPSSSFAFKNGGIDVVFNIYVT